MTSSPYHHGNLREALVDAATEAARENGPDGVGLRDLARRVGVSHSAAYRHFAHREDLLAEVSARAMADLVEAMEVRMDRADDPDPVRRARRRLVEIGRAYVAYAVAEPGLFRVAFTSLPPTPPGGGPDAGPYGLLSQTLDGLVDVGFLSATARVGAEITCWSAVHGFSMLSIEGPLALASPEERSAELDHVLAAIDRSYAASTGSPGDPADVLT